MLKSMLRKFFLFSLLISSVTWLPAQVSPETLTEARAIVEKFMTDNHIPGASVTVTVRGAVVWSEGFGYADLENQVPVVPDRTLFRIGSVSKPITAAALGLLYDQGKINLDAPIQTYVPDFPVKKYPITLRQLAGHIAGIRHYRDNEMLSSAYYPTVKSGLSIFAQDTLLFQPGTKYSYSSYAWNLISAAIEQASGEDFLSYVQHHVFDYLGMTNTYADQNREIIPNRARFYQTDAKGKAYNALYVDNSYKWAGGGFISTTEDLARFANAHLGSWLLSDTTRNIWMTSQHTTDGKATNYGIGWATNDDSHGHHWVGHSGGSVGGITQMVTFPEQGVTIAMLTNVDPVRYGDTHLRIAHLFFPQQE